MGDIDERAGEKQNISLARAVLYRFFSRCFSYPDMDLLKLFEGDILTEYLEAWRVLGLDASEETAKVTGWLESAGPEAALSQLQLEYTRIFVNAFPSIPTPPYSSVYLGKDRLVWGPSTAQAARLYEAAGLYPSADFAEIPDHIAAEVEFVSYLILEQQKPGQEGVTSRELASIEKQFLTDHFFKWIPQFLNRVAENTTTVFYSGIPTIALKFTEFEEKLISSGVK